MTEQKKRISESTEYIRSRSPFKKEPLSALVTYKNPFFLREFSTKKKLKYADIPPFISGEGNTNEGEFIFGKLNNSTKGIYILNGRYNFYNGYKMRQVSHPIYVLKELGVKTVILIDEVGFLNPRFEAGGTALIYDHINLMGGNPLIGENDASLGPRFPDMSNAYDGKLYKKTETYLKEKKFSFYPSVYLGLTGPETETESECRFYREIYSDVLGYSLIPENIAAVHCGLKCLAFGMISRELVADRLKEISDEERLKNRVAAEKKLSKIIKDIINII